MDIRVDSSLETTIAVIIIITMIAMEVITIKKAMARGMAKRTVLLKHWLRQLRLPQYLVW